MDYKLQTHRLNTRILLLTKDFKENFIAKKSTFLFLQPVCISYSAYEIIVKMILKLPF